MQAAALQQPEEEEATQWRGSGVEWAAYHVEQIIHGWRLSLGLAILGASLW